jgi:hypothetical protein
VHLVGVLFIIIVEDTLNHKPEKYSETFVREDFTVRIAPSEFHHTSYSTKRQFKQRVKVGQSRGIAYLM